MKLNKRYFRSIRENISFYLSAMVLTAAALFLFYMFYIAGNAILDFSDEFFSEQRLEDANFTTYLPISDEAITALEQEYDLTLERERYLNVETDGVTARVCQKTKKIDLYEVTVGEDVRNDDEVIISEGYAVKQKVALGDSLNIGGKSYTVTGFFQRPDYLYMLENEDDSYKNITTFYLAYMTDSAFAELGESSSRYLVRYTKDNSVEFRRAVYADYALSGYTAREDNPRIVMVNSQAELFVAMSWLILCILPLITVALVSIIISRKVKNEQRMIGTLSALGYKKGQLMRHYAGFAALPGLFGGILTAVLSAVCAQPYSEMGLQDYEPMRVQGHLNPLIAVLGIVIPTLMYVAAALLSVRRLLKKDTVLLLAANADASDKKRKRILADKKLSFRKKFALRSLIGNPARGFVVLLGVFLGSYIVLLSFGMFDSMETTVDDASDVIGSYEYQYLLNGLLRENPYGGEELLIAGLESEEGRTLSLFGTDADNLYLNFRDENGKNVDIGDGYYISTLTAAAFGWQTGDRVTLYNPLTMEKSDIVISGVIKNDVMKVVYTSRENGAELLKLESGVYNALLSDRELELPSSVVVRKNCKSDLRDQIDTVIDQTGFMLYFLMGLGVVICIASVYVSVNMMVTENRSNISMLKVLGYRDRQIDRIVLSVNHIFLPLGILLSIPATYATGRMFFALFADTFSMLITTAVFLKSYLLTITLTTASYAVSLLLVRRKVKRVDMIESLKDNRE